jgi:hypothetical protein
MIALIIFRQLATRRPVGFLGQNSLRIGSIRRQSPSGISQIVPSGLRRCFRRPIAAVPVTAPMASYLDISSFKQKAFRRFSDSFLILLSEPVVLVVLLAVSQRRQ